MAASDASARPEVAELTAEQQEKLRHFKIKTRMENERYLRAHPEVEVLIGDFLRDVLLQRPADIREFAAGHFRNPKLQEVVVSKMKVSGNME